MAPYWAHSRSGITHVNTLATRQLAQATPLRDTYVQGDSTADTSHYGVWDSPP